MKTIKEEHCKTGAEATCILLWSTHKRGSYRSPKALTAKVRFWSILTPPPPTGYVYFKGPGNAISQCHFPRFCCLYVDLRDNGL